jgi:hypothetical protein
MAHLSDKPFASIESAQEFIALLFDTVSEAKHEVETDLVAPGTEPSRRLEALKLAAVHLHNLEHHLIRTRRILNDLRSMRRLLFDERTLATTPATTNVRRVDPLPIPTVPAPPFQVGTRRAIRAMSRAAGAD